MKIQKNSKKSNTDASLEFYSVLDEIKDLYENRGYKKAKSIYRKMKEIHNWEMCYGSFIVYFNKEIKRPSAPLKATKEKEKSDNGYQQKKEEQDEQDAQDTSALEIPDFKKNWDDAEDLFNEVIPKKDD